MGMEESKLIMDTLFINTTKLFSNQFLEMSQAIRQELEYDKFKETIEPISTTNVDYELELPPYFLAPGGWWWGRA